MRNSTGNTPTVSYISLLFILWFTAWLIALPFIAENNRDILFFILGTIPVTGWFLIKPSRFSWFYCVITGIQKQGE
jgi:hypothetical protein